MKYIDAEKLKAHIEAKMEILWDKLPDADKEHPTDIELRDLGMYMALEGLIDDLDSLQQEQPEVDLEKEFEMQADHFPLAIIDELSDDGKIRLHKELYYFARHFYELGLNARKEESK